MTTLHHLQTKLRTLKLSGMLQTKDQRVALAQQQHLGFLDFLELLLEDEIQHRE